jgi:two-component system OmpR family sensor kinase
MSSPELRRLRLRLTLSYAGASLLALAALAVLAIAVANKREHEKLDSRVLHRAIVSQGYAYGPDKLTIDRSPDGPFEAGVDFDPPVVVIGPTGNPLAGTASALDLAAARRAFDRAKQAGPNQIIYSDTVNGKRSRVASAAVGGNDTNLAAVVATEPIAQADDAVRSFAVKVVAGTLALWLLTIALGWLLAGRALRPAVAVARREEGFLADAAHELRTPVAVIRARAEQSLRESGGTSPESGALRAIAGAAEQATNTIADMLELARLDARRSRIEREPLRLDALVEQVVEEFEDDARGAGVELRTEVEEQLVVEGDERLLARAIANLVQNAIRYGGVGGEVRISLRRDGEDAVVEVADRGPGVPPAQRKAIFDRFHRASSEAGGAGLGLPIARLVAESHDGSLELLPKAEGETGAHFLLRLPIHTPA